MAPNTSRVTFFARSGVQKFELAGRRRRLELVARTAPDVPAVHADLGMIERV